MIKCFCNCPEYPKENINSVLLAGVNGVLLNDDGNTLLRKFAMRDDPKDIPYVIKMLNCYKLCQDVLNEPKDFKNLYEEIKKLCSSFPFEVKLTELFESDSDDKQIQECMEEIQKKCCIDIRIDNVYMKFIKELEILTK